MMKKKNSNELTAKLIHSEPTKKFYKLSQKITKTSDGEPIDKSIKGITILQKEYEHLLEETKDGVDIICISDANSHYERLAFVGFKIEPDEYGYTFTKIAGTPTAMIYGGDINSIKEPEYYIEELCKANNLIFKGIEKMKKFNELTDNELVGLSQEEIRKYISLDKMEKGIPLASASIPKEPDYEEEIEPDKVVYNLEINYSTISAYEDQETAYEVLKTINNFPVGINLESFGYDSRFVVGPDNRSVRIKEVKIFSSKELANTAHTIKENNRKLKQEYDEKYKEYTEILESNREIENQYYNAVSAAQQRIDENRKLIDIFNSEYLPIADDFSTALKYFSKVYTVPKELRDKVKQFIKG